jgi:hypothetical protein
MNRSRNDLFGGWLHKEHSVHGLDGV